MTEGKKDKLVAQLVSSNQNMWVFDRKRIDEDLDTVLEENPEERLWLVVSSNHVSEYVFPTYRLRLHDVIKIGRVRFRVREIVSRQYNEDH